MYFSFTIYCLSLKVDWTTLELNGINKIIFSFNHPTVE